MQAFHSPSHSRQIKINFSQFNQLKGRHAIDEELLNRPMEEGQILVHINSHVCNPECVIFCVCSFRIDPGVYLLPNSSSSKSLLVHAINAEINKEIVFQKKLTEFSLLFSGLPKSATSFHFIEPGKKGWRLLNIKRNTSDVYVLKAKKSEIKLIT